MPEQQNIGIETQQIINPLSADNTNKKTDKEKVKMKKLILTAMAVMTMASGAFAATGVINQSADVYSPPIVVQKDSDMSIVIYKTEGVSTYTDASPEWQSSQMVMGKVQAVGDTNTPFALTYPSTIVTTKGGDTSTITQECRALNTGYVANKADGVACGTSYTSDASNGKAFLAFVPVATEFSAGATSGVYTQPFIVGINYF